MPGPRVTIDACVYDWLLESARSEEFLAKERAGYFEIVPLSQVAVEVAQMIPPDAGAQKREKWLRLTPFIFVGGRGFAPSVAAVIVRDRANPRKIVDVQGTTPERTAQVRTLLALGIDKLEAVHLVDAAEASCAVFLTTDRRDLLDKSERLAAVKRLLNIEILAPEDLLDRYA